MENNIARVEEITTGLTTARGQYKFTKSTPFAFVKVSLEHRVLTNIYISKGKPLSSHHQYLTFGIPRAPQHGTERFGVAQEPMEQPEEQTAEQPEEQEIH
jgi:hypothetical protein